MAKQSKADRELNDTIAESYRRCAMGRVINVLKIGPLFKDVRAELLAGRFLDDAMRDAIERYAEPVKDTHPERNRPDEPGQHEANEP